MEYGRFRWELFDINGRNSIDQLMRLGYSKLKECDSPLKHIIYTTIRICHVNLKYFKK